MRNKRGQVWVETVIYTLVAFTLMGLVLAFARPKIEELQDKGVIEQSIEIVKEIDTIINNIGSTGNQRVLSVGISKGSLIIDGVDDDISFELESSYEYSEPGADVQVDNLVVHNEQTGDINTISITATYSNYNIKVKGADELRRIERSSTPYKIIITNSGLDGNRKIIDIEVV